MFALFIYLFFFIGFIRLTHSSEITKDHRIAESRLAFKNWISGGIDLNTIHFDPLQEVYQYFFKTPSKCTTTVPFNNLNVLVFGDSVDYYIIQESCKYWNGTFLSSWSEKFTYKNGSGTVGCKTPFGM